MFGLHETATFNISLVIPSCPGALRLGKDLAAATISETVVRVPAGPFTGEVDLAGAVGKRWFTMLFNLPGRSIPWVWRS